MSESDVERLVRLETQLRYIDRTLEKWGRRAWGLLFVVLSLVITDVVRVLLDFGVIE